MLRLMRFKDQRIRINDDIVIVVCETRGDRVQLGIEAPKDVKIYREEVYQAKLRDGEIKQRS